MIFDANIPVAIEFVAPKEGVELASSNTGTQIDVITRLTGQSPGQTVHLALDDTAFVPMTLDGNVASAHVATALNSGEHTLIVEVRDTQQQAVARKRSKVTFNNTENVALAVERTEPTNNAIEIEPTNPSISTLPGPSTRHC